MHLDAEKERTLTNYQLKKAKFEAEKHSLGAKDLKQENIELKHKVKRYITLIEEQKTVL